MKPKIVGRSENIYINEIIRINYKCNWKCKFCNVLKVNNYGDQDITEKEIIYQILSIAKKYTEKERGSLILSFSGGEPTLNKNLIHYIKLAKTLGVGVIEIQTNGSILFKNKKLLDELIDAGLDEIFLAQHSHLKEINQELGIYYNISDFIDWVNYIKENEIDKQIKIYLNIVIGKINLPIIKEYIRFLIEVGFIELIQKTLWCYEDGTEKSLHKVSFGLTQPNGYAQINADEVLLKYDEAEMVLMHEFIKFCEQNSIFLDFHFTSPPLCILDYKNYNLEYSRLQKLAQHRNEGNINDSNLESYKFLWKEKKKFPACNQCIYNDYCLGFYRNWIEYVGVEYAENKVIQFINNP